MTCDSLTLCLLLLLLLCVGEGLRAHRLPGGRPGRRLRLPGERGRQLQEEAHGRQHER